MTGLDQANAIPSVVKSIKDAHDLNAGQGKDRIHALRDKLFHQTLGSIHNRILYIP
jgi:hypothetical protein